MDDRIGKGQAALLAALRGARLVDLTHPLHAAMPLFPARVPMPFERQQTATMAGMGVNSGRFSMSEHQGTHLDAPCHFTMDGISLERIPAEHLVAPAVLVDITEAAAADETYRLSPDDVKRWETDHGPIPAQSYVLVRSGWADRWSDPVRYGNADVEGGLRHPAIEPEAARMLVERGALGVGIDTFSVDNLLVGTAKGASHKVLHDAGRYVLENLARLDELPAMGIVLFIGALPIVDGTGGPARVLAFVDA